MTMTEILVALVEKSKDGRGWYAKVRGMVFTKKFSQKIAMWNRNPNGDKIMKKERATYVRQGERLTKQRQLTASLYHKVGPSFLMVSTALIS